MVKVQVKPRFDEFRDLIFLKDVEISWTPQ